MHRLAWRYAFVAIGEETDLPVLSEASSSRLRSHELLFFEANTFGIVLGLGVLAKLALFQGR